MAQFPIDIKIDTSDASKLGPLNRQLNETDRAATGASAAAGALAAAVGTIATTATLAQIVKLTDSYTKVQNSIVNVVGSTAELTQRTGELLRVANQSRSSFEATAALYGKLKRATDELGISQDRVLRITELVNRGFVASGATSTEASNAITQLAQGLSAGALRGDEFNSVAEQAPVILRAVSQETGKTVGELREFAAEGKITSELLIRSIENYGDTIDREFARTAVTFDQQRTVAANLATEWVGSSDNIRAASQAAGAVLVTLAENLDTVASAATTLAAVYGTRLVGQIVAKQAAAIKANAQTAESIKLEQAEAAAALRRAEAEKSAAAIQLSAAREVTAAKRAQAAVEAQLTVASEAKRLSDVAEAARVSKLAAAAEVERLKATLGNITAEQSLEKTRLAAQISERGRIDTATRMAVLGRDRALIETQLNAAEKALTATTGQLATAEAAATAVKNNSVVATNKQIASSAALVAARNAETAAVERAAIAAATAQAATAKLTAANTAAAATGVLATATRGLSSAMAFLGGPAGVAILAGSALLYYADSVETAGRAARESKLTEELGKLTDGFKEMTREGQRKTLEELTQQQIDLNTQLSEANRLLDESKRKAEEAGKARGQSFVGGDVGASAQLAAASARVVELQAQLDATTQKLNALFGTRAPDADKWLQPSKPEAVIQFYDDLTTKMQQQIALIGLTEVEQARLQARQELLNKAAKDGVTLTEAQITAYADLAAQGVVKQQQYEADQYVLTLAKQVAAQRDVGVQAEINANLSRLGANATAEQRAQVEALTQSLYAQQMAERALADLNAARQIGTTPSAANPMDRPLADLEAELEYKRQILFDSYYQGAIEREKDALSYEEYQQRLLNLDTEYAEKRAQVQYQALQGRTNAERQAQAQILGLTTNVLDQIAGKIEESKGKESGAYKAAFIASKAAAIAQAVIQTELASVAALAPPPIGLGPVAGLPYSQVIRGLGYASIGLMAGQAVAGFADGGYVSGAGTGRSDSIPAWLSNGEFVMPANRTDQYRTELDAMRRGTFGGAGQTTGARVTINNYASDVADVRVTEGPDGELIATIDRRIAEQTPGIMAEQAGDPYSRFNRSMGSQYVLERR